MAARNYIKLVALEALFIGQVILAGANGGYFQSPNRGPSAGSRSMSRPRPSNEEAIAYLLYYMSQMPSSRNNHRGGSSYLDHGVKRYRIGSEFIGKRSIAKEAVPSDVSQEETSGELPSLESLEDPVSSKFFGKRMGSEFLGKRMGSEFLGKRLGSEFLGKRIGSEFLGKRMGSEFLGKRTPELGSYGNEMGHNAEDPGFGGNNKYNWGITFLPPSAIRSGLNPQEETNWDNDTHRWTA